MSSHAPRRRFPIGAEVVEGGGAHLRVWAPTRRRVEVVHSAAGDAGIPLTPEGDGYFAGADPGLRPGDRYGFRLDGDRGIHPDPASRFQPDGPEGLSVLVDPGRFRWSDATWSGLQPLGQVIYELHIGTFTREGTYAAAAAQLPGLRELGITTVELMPLAEFPGRFGWGYDGVDLWAPSHLYGQPDDLRRLIDEAHRLGLGVILDVVYNHLGPAGNVLPLFSPDYFTDRYQNEWGAALNFDGPNAGPVREFFVENAAYWIEEFHFDGLRIDAASTMHDASKQHVLAELGQRVRQAARGRGTLIVAESESQDARLVRPVARGGYGLDAVWNDDFHHAALVALTAHNEAYYSDYRGTPQELISALRWGYLYQGQWYRWQGKGRGTPALDIPAPSFVLCLENHDQVANSRRGLRLPALTSPGRLRAMTALQLLAPGTPMLFQGQEIASRRPFLYFADHDVELRRRIAEGRAEFLAQFPSLASAEARASLPRPEDPETFQMCKPGSGDASRPEAAEALALHRDLLALRRTEAAFRQQRRDGLHGAVLGPQALALRFHVEESNDDDGDRLLLVNLGPDLALSPIPEPLLAPPAGRPWWMLWSSESVRYGGAGPRDLDTTAEWVLPGESALVLR